MGGGLVEDGRGKVVMHHGQVIFNCHLVFTLKTLIS